MNGFIMIEIIFILLCVWIMIYAIAFAWDNIKEYDNE